MKKILLNSYTEGNMEELYKYYCENLKSTYNDTLDVRLINAKNYKKNKFLHYKDRVIQMLNSYDVHLTDFSITLSKRSKKNIFMSHGYGTKSTPGKNELDNKKKMKFYKNIREKMDYVVTLGYRDATYFLRSEELDKCKSANYVPLGLPRNDVLFNKEFVDYNYKRVREKFNIGNKKILLYCPTWREWEIDKSPYVRNYFEKLNKYLGKNGWILMYRGHYISGLVDEKLISGLENIMVADFKTEPFTQALISAADVLMTDYSSIFVDYLILNRPILFMNFDKEKYDDIRGLALNFDNKTEAPGEEVVNITEIINALTQLDNGVDKYKEDRLKAQKIYYEYFDGNTCKRIWNLIIEMCK